MQIDDIHGFEFLTIPVMHIQTVLTHSPMAHSLEKASGAQQQQVGREAWERGETREGRKTQPTDSLLH